MGCSLKKCRKPKHYVRIRANLELWRAKKNLVKKPSAINIADYVKNAEGDDELTEMLLALTKMNKMRMIPHQRKKIKPLAHSTVISRRIGKRISSIPEK